ncbi:MAG: hypothetical protein HOE90_08390 [Bacteriovoracaceae bacterium]|jgi:hypothetical protein|nr:hypothetical protein [Bacteriovoracaceae bacterium]
MKHRNWQLFITSIFLFVMVFVSCTDTGSKKTVEDDETSDTVTSGETILFGGGDDDDDDDDDEGGGQVDEGCISGDGSGSDGVFSFTADGSGGNRQQDDGMIVDGAGYRIEGGHIWSISNDPGVPDKQVLGDMDTGSTVKIKLQPQSNPGGESLGDVAYCNTGANYTRLTVTVLLGKYKDGIFYPTTERTFTGVDVNDCSVEGTFNVPSYILSDTQYPDVVVKSVKSDGDCISYGASCDVDPLVAGSACWRTKVYLKMPYASDW